MRKLAEEGVSFGAQPASRQRLTALTTVEVVREVARARATLQQGLGRPVSSFAYPLGAVDERVAHLVGACGYSYGLQVGSAPCTLADGLLELPRLDAAASASLEQFVRSLA